MDTKITTAPQFGGRGWHGTRSRFLEIAVDDTRSLGWVLLSSKTMLTFKPKHFFNKRAHMYVGYDRSFFIFDDRDRSGEAVGPRAFDFWLLNEAARRSDCILILSRRMSEATVYRTGRAIPEEGNVTIIATTKALADEWGRALSLCRVRSDVGIQRFTFEPSERAVARALRRGKAIP